MLTHLIKIVLDNAIEREKEKIALLDNEEFVDEKEGEN